jgi:hypothetical protein
MLENNFKDYILPMEVKENDIIIFSSGDYSSYSIDMVCKAKTNFNIQEIKKEYLLLFPELKNERNFNTEKFINWILINKNIMKEINPIEYHNYDLEGII